MSNENPTVEMTADDVRKRRVVIFTTALAKALGQPVPAHGDTTAREILAERGLHAGLLDPRVSIAALERAQPRLIPLFDEAGHPTDDDPVTDHHIDTAIVGSHALLRMLSDQPHQDGPGGQASGESFSTFKQELERLKKKSGKSGKGEGEGKGEGDGEGGDPGQERGEDGHNVGEGVSETDLLLAVQEAEAGRGFYTNPEQQHLMAKREAAILAKMPLLEMLKNPDATRLMTPSLELVATLINIKGKLEGVALQSAKRLIRRYCEDAMKITASDMNARTGIQTQRRRKRAEPKKSLSNVDMLKTVNRNLHNYDPERGVVIVDQQKLVYKPNKSLKDQGRIIICVDQSGSMAESLIHAAILASIFSSRGRDVRMYIYDTQYVDLSAYCKDPLEVLLQANLGGGTDGLGCALQATKDLRNPSKDLILWISDFDDNPALLPVFKGWLDLGVTFIPVGPISDRGYRGVNKHFQDTLKGWQCSILQGGLKTLLAELKAVLGQAQ